MKHKRFWAKNKNVFAYDAKFSLCICFSDPQNVQVCVGENIMENLFWIRENCAQKSSRGHVWVAAQKNKKNLLGTTTGLTLSPDLGLSFTPQGLGTYLDSGPKIIIQVRFYYLENAIRLGLKAIFREEETTTLKKIRPDQTP